MVDNLGAISTASRGDRAHTTPLGLRRGGLGLVLLMAWALSGCVTSVTSLQTARTLDPGQVQVTGAMTASVTTSTIGQAIEAIDASSNRLDSASAAGEPITEQEQQEALEALLGLLLFQPGVATEIIGRVGVVDDFDLGLRYTGQLVKGDGKFRFWHRDGQSAALSLGYAYHFGPSSTVLGSVFDLLDYFDVGSFKRHDLDANLLWGVDYGEWLSVYAGARYIISLVQLDPEFQKVLTETSVPSSDADGIIHHLGATTGLFIGYRWVFVNLEMNVLQVFWEPKILGVKRDFSGTLISPAAGLTFRY